MRLATLRAALILAEIEARGHATQPQSTAASLVPCPAYHRRIPKIRRSKAAWAAIQDDSREWP